MPVIELPAAGARTLRISCIDGASEAIVRIGGRVVAMLSVLATNKPACLDRPRVFPLEPTGLRPNQRHGAILEDCPQCQLDQRNARASCEAADSKLHQSSSAKAHAVMSRCVLWCCARQTEEKHRAIPRQSGQSGPLSPPGHLVLRS